MTDLKAQAFYTKKEAAEILKISVKTLDRLRTAQKLEGVRNGRRIFFRGRELIDFWNSLPSANASF